MNSSFISKKAHNAIMLLLGFISTAVIGGFLLMLPFAAENGGISFIDALFTATSAVCVTGLTVVDTGSTFSLFGQIVIMILIQFGGLGIMTVSVFLFNSLGKAVGISQRQLLQTLYAHTPRKDIQNILYSIFTFTFLTEIIGIVSLFLIFQNVENISNPLFSAVFHSVSAFCNAGFSLFPDNFVLFRDHFGINAILIILIVLGGIGFPVIYEIICLKFKKLNSSRIKLSLQSITVLTTTAILITGGALLFYFIEDTNILYDKAPISNLVTSLFQSVTCRTAGFNTVEISKLNELTLFLLIILMFIGASPGSCGGGIKTTTFSVVLSYSHSKLRNKSQTSLFKRSISDELVIKSLTIVIIYFFLITVFLFCILFLERDNPKINHINYSAFLSVLFEVVSAIGTVGLSTGITSMLNNWSKLFLIILMIVGRVGPISIAYIIIGNKTQIKKKYAEENIMIG